MSLAPYLPRIVRTWDGPPGPKAIEGTLVSVDLSGFTRLSERLQAKGRAGAEELVLAVSGVFEGLIGISDRHGGDVLKFRGDALLLFFDGEAHEVRGCRAASDMQWLIERSGPTMSSVGPVTLRMSTGVHTGTCHFFLVEGTHLELIVAGPAATATIRLESAASAGQILISPRTAETLDPRSVGAEQHGGRLLTPLTEGVVRETPTAVERVPGRLEAFIPERLQGYLSVAAGEAEHRQVAAAFLRFDGVDQVIETEGVEAAHERIASLAAVVGEELHRLGLTWLESDIEPGGGKLYLVGGAPSSTGDDEDRMLRALQAIIRRQQSGLDVRAGVNRGPAFCGEIGATTRRTYAVMGDTVNLAARLASRAAPRSILATADVLDRAPTQFETTPQPFLVKGKERPITAYSVGDALGKKDEPGPVELPLTGRDAELRVLAEALEGARQRRRQLVELVAEPGMGKSRLVEELRRQAIGFTQLNGACDQYSTSSPYAVMRALLRPLAGITPEMDAREAGARLVPWVGAVMPDLVPMLPLLALAFDAEVAPTPESEEIEPQFRRERMHESVTSFLTRVLLMPTLIVVEDAHWLDDASRALLVHLAQSPLPHPWLICVTRRPQAEAFVDPEAEGHRLLTLGPIEPDAARSLALAAAGGDAFAADVLQVLVERSGGNPLFIRELVAASRGSGDVASLPDSIERLILTRMDTLAPEDRFLLRNASVLGTTFSLDLLMEVLEPDLQDVADLGRWDRLSEFVAWSDAGELRFLHDLIRAVAYEGLSFRRRRVVHARIGEALERSAGTAVDEIADLLSLHFHRAHEHERTWRYAVLAGRRAQEQAATVDAVELYARALDVAEESGATSDEIAAVAESLGDVAELSARYEQAEAAYSRARNLTTDVITESHLLRKEGVVRERTGRYPDALRRYSAALNTLERAEGGVEKARSLADLELAYAGVKYRQGDFDAAHDWAARAADHARAGEDRARLAHAYYLSHIAAVDSGRRDPEHRDAALAILQEVGDLGRLTNLQNNVGIEAYFDGRWDEAIEWYRRSAGSARRVGDVVNVARAQNNEAEILSDQGRLDEARELFEEALRVWRAAGYRIGIALASSNLGRAAARAGSFAEAHRLLDEAAAQFREVGADALARENATRIAECYVLEGRHREASAALAPLLAEQSASVSRLAGYATVQAREPLAKAQPYFDAALAAADAAGSPYERALTLRALAALGLDGAAEAEELLERLGVKSTPDVPLP